MNYKIMTGKFETGTDEQQNNFNLFFGSNETKQKFDLYFHWYNLIHELGHALMRVAKVDIHPADEEQLVNDFAVAYWRQVDGNSNLNKVETLVNDILDRHPCPIPGDENYLDYFRENWYNIDMLSVAIYGFFQMSCVKNSFDTNKSLSDVLKGLGYSNIDTSVLTKKTYEIGNESVSQIANDCIENLRLLGIDMPEINVYLVDNPEIHCCNSEE